MPAPSVTVGSIWQHRKGGTYRVLGVGSFCSSADRSVDGRAVVVYCTADEPTLWVRPLAEFLDGRFVQVGVQVDVQCGAQLYLADDFGDNSATMKCQLPPCHLGPHQEKFEREVCGKPQSVLTTWTQDERAACERHGVLDESQGADFFGCGICDKVPIRCRIHGEQAENFCNQCSNEPYVCPVHGLQGQSFCRVGGCTNEPDFKDLWTKMWPVVEQGSQNTTTGR